MAKRSNTSSDVNSGLQLTVRLKTVMEAKDKLRLKRAIALLLSQVKTVDRPDADSEPKPIVRNENQDKE